MTPPSPPPGPPSPGSGLPLVDADAAEQALGDEMDDIVPTHGFHRLPLVGLGGSAGSLGALSRFFEATPAGTGMAYVTVLHLAPDHHSILPELL